MNADPGPGPQLNADPGPGTQLNADPGPGIQLNADPDPRKTIHLLLRSWTPSLRALSPKTSLTMVMAGRRR
jgi:hypothetical protein